MKELKKTEEKKVKISITLSPDLDKRMEERAKMCPIRTWHLRNIYASKDAETGMMRCT